MTLADDQPYVKPFHAPQPGRFPAMYASGMSVSEIAAKVNRSKTYVRNRLLKRGVKLRTREEGSRISRERGHWHYVLPNETYRVRDYGVITDDKSLLLTLVITEGHRNRSCIAFTNTQEPLHEEFRRFVHSVYGDVHVGRTRIQSKVGRVEIAREVGELTPQKAFAAPVLEFIMRSPSLTSRVLRIIADTEGSMILSVKKAPRNLTVEHRVVLASYNPVFTEQIVTLLKSIGIHSTSSRVGAQVMQSEAIVQFIEKVGFSPGLRVIKRKAGHSIWFGCDKSVISKVFLRVNDEQRRVWGRRDRGFFADCRTREETVERLMSVYRQVSGG
jgi:hypothetical protein